MKANEEFELDVGQIQEALDRACTSNYIYTVKYIQLKFSSTKLLLCPYTFNQNLFKNGVDE